MTYFGNTETHDVDMSLALAWYNVGVPFTCPGEGIFDVVELGVQTLAPPGTVRLAIYLLEGSPPFAFYTQGAAEMNIVADYGWTSHTSFVDVNGDSMAPTVIGGNNYIVAVSGDTANGKMGGVNSANSAYYVNANYTDSGFPATMSGGTLGSWLPCVRIGITEHIPHTPMAHINTAAIIGVLRRVIAWLKSIVYSLEWSF